MYAIDGMARTLEDFMHQAFQTLDIATVEAADTDAFDRLAPKAWAAIAVGAASEPVLANKARRCLAAAAARRPPDSCADQDKWWVWQMAYLFAWHLDLDIAAAPRS